MELLITKFRGSHTNWFRFWNQSESEISISQLSIVSKFSYIQEVTSLKVQVIIDGWPLKVGDTLEQQTSW